MVPAGAHALARRDYPPKVAPEEFIIESVRLAAFEFNGEQIYFFIINDEITPWLDAQTLARILGYKDPKTVARNLSTIWAAYMQAMYIAQKILFNNLDKLKVAVFTANTANFPGINNKTRSVLLINERGIDLILTLSDQPKAREFKMWLLEVQEDLKRYGSYALDGSHRQGPHQVTLPAQSSTSLMDPKTALALRKLELAEKAEERRSKEVDRKDRESRAGAYDELAALDFLKDEDRQMFRVKALETRSGETDLVRLLPPAKKGWTFDQLGKPHGLNSSLCDSFCKWAATKLGYDPRKNVELSKVVPTPAPGSTRQVDVRYWSEEGKQTIEPLLAEFSEMRRSAEREGIEKRLGRHKHPETLKETCRLWREARKVPGLGDKEIGTLGTLSNTYDLDTIEEAIKVAKSEGTREGKPTPNLDDLKAALLKVGKLKLIEGGSESA